MTMTGFKTTNARPSTWQEFLLASVSLVLVLVMTGQGVAQAAGIGMPTSQPGPASGSVEMSEHDQHRPHEHDASAGTVAGAATDKVAHHAGHADGSGCCPMSVCGGACSGACSGTSVGDSAGIATLSAFSGLSRVGRAMTGDPVLARAFGVPFRPPIPRQLAAG